MLKWAAAAWWSTTYQDDAALSASKEEIWRIWRLELEFGDKNFESIDTFLNFIFFSKFSKFFPLMHWEQYHPDM